MIDQNLEILTCIEKHKTYDGQELVVSESENYSNNMFPFIFYDLEFPRSSLPWKWHL
mgnify:CR=1 FL=1